MHDTERASVIVRAIVRVSKNDHYEVQCVAVCCSVLQYVVV